MTRQRKTPQQRAQEQLDVAERAAKRLDERRTAARAELEQLETEYGAAIARYEHLKKHPDLQHNPTPEEHDA